MNKKNIRETTLLSALKLKGRLSINEVTEILSVSEATARRLLSELDAQGKLVRTYGGAQLPTMNIPYSYDLHVQEKAEEKLAIGRAAAELIEEGDTIYLDCGTTVQQLAEALGGLISEGRIERLNVVTNSLVNVQTIPPFDGIKVILIGGTYNSKRRDFSGPLTERYASDFYFTKAFMGCDGCSIDSGFSSGNIDISSLNTTVIQRSERTYILMDSGKFGRNGVLSYAQLSEAYMIVTEKEPSELMKKTLEKARVKVLLTDAEVIV